MTGTILLYNPTAQRATDDSAAHRTLADLKGGDAAHNAAALRAKHFRLVAE